MKFVLLINKLLKYISIKNNVNLTATQFVVVLTAEVVEIIKKRLTLNLLNL